MQSVEVRVTIEYDPDEITDNDLDYCIDTEIGGLYNCPGINHVYARRA